VVGGSGRDKPAACISGDGGVVVAGDGQDEAPLCVWGDGGVVGETRPLLMFEVTEGWWWL
jgi:hypothetical protein